MLNQYSFVFLLYVGFLGVIVLSNIIALIFSLLVSTLIKVARNKELKYKLSVRENYAENRTKT